MDEEWFDIVDTIDRVTGRATRAEVHRRGLLHRSVHVLVFDAAGRVFLQKRSMTKDTWPGAWDSSASGHVDSGETYDACSVRELREELGWSPRGLLRPLFKVDACEATSWEFTRVYACEGEGPFELNRDEIERGEWFSVAEVNRAIEARPGEFAASFRCIWSRALDERYLPAATGD